MKVKITQIELCDSLCNNFILAIYLPPFYAILKFPIADLYVIHGHLSNKMKWLFAKSGANIWPSESLAGDGSILWTFNKIVECVNVMVTTSGQCRF